MIKYFIGFFAVASCTGQMFENQWEYVASHTTNEAIEELYEIWDYYKQNPIDLSNMTELKKIKELQLMTVIEESNLIQFCSEHKISSIYQLQQCNIDLITLERIKPFIRTNFIINKNSSKADYFAGIQHATSGKNSMYIGSAYKFIIKYKRYPNQTLRYGLTLEKDAGEPLIYKSRQINNLSFTIEKKFPRGKIIFGKYDLNIGEGLLFKTSYHINSAHFLNSGTSNDVKSSYSPKESNFLNGVCYQHTERNYISKIFFSTKKISGISSINKSGLYRTASEIDRMNSNNETILGLQFSISHSKSELAIAHIIYDSKLHAKTPVYFQSISYNKNYYNATYCFELANENYSKWAYIHKIYLALNKKCLVTIQHRNRNNLMFNEYRSDYTAQSNGYEKGGYFAIQYQAKNDSQLKMAIDNYQSNQVYQSPPFFRYGRAYFFEYQKTFPQKKLIMRLKYQKPNDEDPTIKLKISSNHLLHENLSISNIINYDNYKNTGIQLNCKWKSNNKRKTVNSSVTYLSTSTNSIYWQAPYFYGYYNSRFYSGKYVILSIGFQAKLSSNLKIGIENIYNYRWSTSMDNSDNISKEYKGSFYIKWRIKD